MSAIDRITIAPDVCGGRPCIRGLRIRVRDVLDLLAATDALIRSYAATTGAVIITKDEDSVVRELLEKGRRVV